MMMVVTVTLLLTAYFLLQFDPGRWSEPFADKDPSSGAARWVPFSIGPKACAGQNLAVLQCKSALSLLLAAYQWSLSPSMG